MDHAVRTQEHYSTTKAGQQAGAVTYFAFLSFFPVLALSFFVVGWLAKVYPGARSDLRDALNAVMPGLVGQRDGQVQISDIESAAGAVGIVGVLALLYSGLGWLSAMRDALTVVFVLPAKEQPGFVLGKLRDLLTLTVIGTTLFVSVAVAGLVGGFSTDLLEWAELNGELGWLVKGLTVLLGFAANAVLFFAMFRLLADPNLPRRALWSGALLGASGFEILKQLSTLLFKATQGSPAFQAFGIALIVLVWISYFSRVVLYAAAWARTAPSARAALVAAPAAPVEGPPSPSLADHPARRGSPPWLAPYVAGAATMLGLIGLVRHTGKRSEP